jgi:LacI family transcriptional regulator
MQQINGKIMKVTIYDIAKEAQTSPSTVSRVLNSSSLISNEKSHKILAAAKKLGYEKRSIRKQRGRAVLSVKLILGQLKNRKLPLIYSVPELIQGIKEGLPENQINIICETSSEPDVLFANKKAGHIDAIIFAFSNVPKATIRHLKKQNIPYLVLNRAPKNEDFISFHNEDGMRKLAKAAISKKQKASPLFLEMNPLHEVTIERRQGFLMACQDESIDNPHVEVLKDISDIDAGLVEKFKTQGYNCIICMNDIIAATFMVRALDEGCHFPNDFSLTGFDGSSIINILPRKLDTISLELLDLGHKSGEWIRRRVIAREEELFQIRIDGKRLKGNTL